LKALRKGFTLVEMLVAASIACVFLLSVMNVLALSGKFFEIADSQALKTEQSIIYYETFTKMASKRFSPKEYKSIDQVMLQVLGWHFYFQAIDVPKFIKLGSPNDWVFSVVALHSPSPEVMSVFGQYGSSDPQSSSTSVIGQDGGSGSQNSPLLGLCAPSIKQFSLVGKKVYLKPAYVGEYKYGQERGSGWDRGDLLPFDQRIFDDLIQAKKNGNVSRIYLVVAPEGTRPN
jgi:prepilin-type N-terminal cleavage/methylation domain-containing protein